MSSSRSVRKLEDLFLEKFLEKYKLTERDIKKAFSKFDKDGNGSLDVEELSACIQQFLNGVSSGDIAELVRCYDVNGDGRLSYEEFTQFLLSRSATNGQQLAPEPSYNRRNDNSHSNDNRRHREAGGRSGNVRSELLTENNIRQMDDNQYQGYSDRSRNYPPPPPSDIESVIALDDEAEVHARAVSYLNNLKSLMCSQANQAKSRCKMSDRLSVHNSDLVNSIIRDLISKAFQPCK